MYGTLIGTGAMHNLVQPQSADEEKFTSTYGYIVHQSLNRQVHSTSLKINTKERKFFIDHTVKREGTQGHGLVDTFRLEWKFRESVMSLLDSLVHHWICLV